MILLFFLKFCKGILCNVRLLELGGMGLLLKKKPQAVVKAACGLTVSDD
jgi:hypothetical protein